MLTRPTVEFDKISEADPQAQMPPMLLDLGASGPAIALHGDFCFVAVNTDGGEVGDRLMITVGKAGKDKPGMAFFATPGVEQARDLAESLLRYAAAIEEKAGKSAADLIARAKR